METSLFLAKLIGIPLIVLGLSVILQTELINKVGKQFVDNHAMLFLSGVLLLPSGIAIVSFHNIWVFEWPVIITLWGWISIFAGTGRILVPNIVITVGSNALGKRLTVKIAGGVMVVLGLYLTAMGFAG